jgi:transposase
MQVLTAASSLDIRKHFCVITAINRDGENAFGPDRVEHEDLEARLKKNLLSSDHVVIESATNAWQVYDLLEPLVAKVLVANPLQVK